jgi:A/G-specific adenine glycosylase
VPEKRERRLIQLRLRAWFRRAQRDLPWRHSRDPYSIWVSEVMLQQTQVATVVPYFERFLNAFPNLSALARASVTEVLRLWEGLGYYRRARDLQRAARQLVKHNGGMVPNDPATFGQLPGVGRYTLGAVLSLAFDRKLPIIEANSARVLCRLFGCTDLLQSQPAQRWLWATATALLPDRGIGDFNQALMELGATVCSPRSPRCEQCPLAGPCVARALGNVEQIPLKARPLATTAVCEVAVVLRRRGRLLLVQRPDSGRWAGLWEFPHGQVKPGESLPHAARRMLAEVTGYRAKLGQPLRPVRHSITRFQVTLHGYRAASPRGRFRSYCHPRHAWVLPGELTAYPLSAPQRRLARLLMNE